MTLLEFIPIAFENLDFEEKVDGPVFKKCSGTEAFKRLYSIDTFMEVSCIYLYKKDFYDKSYAKYDFGEMKKYITNFIELLDVIN